MSGGGGSGSGSGVTAGDARPTRDEVLGTPGWRSHEKGTSEALLARGDAAGDGGDGQKVEALVETEEEDEEEQE